MSYGKLRLFFWAAMWMLSLSAPVFSQGESTVPFVVPEGFVVQRVADDTLAHDAHCMTLDSKGRPVVSGAGYIRTLIDSNNDGNFDQGVTLGAWPKQGAQGLWCDETKYYWVADGGLWSANDRNQDGRAEGGPTKVLTFPSGGEHDGHAIRRGPDGHWYLIVGNYANGINALQNDGDAPVERPRAGTIWRISPDFQKRGVFAHGIRNAYDFDFLPTGEIVTFDSDDERDMTLPWYRPTRVMVLTPGSDAGWVSKAWKDADYQITMPHTIASLGRGSPTGVVVYRHTTFPEKYRDAIFVLDWTFGRVIAVFPQEVQTDAEDASKKSVRVGAEVFLQPEGIAGFAPTDICIEPTGSLLVCVGGRGTNGAIYRISYSGDKAEKRPSVFLGKSDSSSDESSDTITATDSQMKDFETVLGANCPLEAWSEKAWLASAERLGGGLLASAAAGIVVSPHGESLSESARCSAIQAITRMRYVLPTEVVNLWLNDPSPRIRAAAYRAMAYGRLKENGLDRWKSSLAKTNEEITDGWHAILGAGELRAKLECVGMNRWSTDMLADSKSGLALPKLEQNMNLTQLWYWANLRSSSKQPTGFDQIAASALYRANASGANGPLMDAIVKRLQDKSAISTEAKTLEMISLIQASLGDPRWTVPTQQDTKDPSVFDGYRSLYGSAVTGKVAEGWSRWLIGVASMAIEKSWREVEAEAVRTLAMLESSDPSAMAFCARQITDRSHPTSDIHHLVVIAKCRGTRDSEVTEACAKGLLGLGEKVRVNGLNTDNQWQPRLLQLASQLMQRDSKLATAMIDSPDFGTADHLIWTEGWSSELREKARGRMAKKLAEIAPRQWTSVQLKFVIAGGVDSETRNVIRSAASEPALQVSIIEFLAAKPSDEDYPVFIAALGSSDRMSWKLAWQGVTRFDIEDAKLEVENLSKLLARLRGSSDEPPSSNVYDRVRRVLVKLGAEKAPNGNTWQAFEPLLEKFVSSEAMETIKSTRRPEGEWLSFVSRAASKPGDVARGKFLFSQAKCAQCHNGQTALGPDLSGIAKRFSMEDLFRSIYEPSRDVSDRYRATKILTADGQVVIGMSIYDAVDGITLQAADGTVVRINKDDIEEKAFATESIMPAGLLEGFTDPQIADLYAYLKTL